MDDARVIVTPATPPAIAQEVVFPGEGVSLCGTIERPRGSPALLLLQGSGPVNRDGNIPGTFEPNLQKQIAEALRSAGVASLRYDKRGEYSNKSELPSDESARAAFMAWDNLVGDAVAAWRFLREQPGIDRERVGFFGHSEGGIVALAAAQQLLDAGEAPALLVLAATPGRPMGEVVHEQIERVMQKRGVNPVKADQLLQSLDEIQHEIAENAEIPETVPGILQPLYKPELVPYWHDLLRLDPAELAKLFPGPVLIIEGTADQQVSARDDALTLDAALSERPADDHDLLIVPRLSHELKQVANPNDPGISGPIKPSLIKDITEWVKEKFFEL
jgi:uncharacterized protein